MFLYALLAAVIAILLIFLAPLRAKVWVATSVISLAAIGAIFLAVSSLVGGEIMLARFSTDLFGLERISVDAISALFLAIIAIASVATVVYSRGYVEGYFKRFSPTHISLHYTALVLLVVSMMMVVISSGGFSFLFSWELMTIASFILILFEADRQEVRRAALNYLVMMHIGFMFLVAGFVMLYNVTGSANFAAVEC